MITFKDYLSEENTQGDIGTEKLTKHRKRLTPNEPMVTPKMLPDFEDLECECKHDK